MFLERTSPRLGNHQQQPFEWEYLNFASGAATSTVALQDAPTECIFEINFFARQNDWNKKCLQLGYIRTFVTHA
jgi:hypothetical protein